MLVAHFSALSDSFLISRTRRIRAQNVALSSRWQVGANLVLSFYFFEVQNMNDTIIIEMLHKSRFLKFEVNINLV